MKKFNRNYLSFYEMIGPLFGFKPDPEQPKEYSFHGFRYHDGSHTPLKNSKDQKIYVGYQLLGALQPFAKMGKDLQDTFRAYMTPDKLKRDLLQPMRGIGNILKGIGSVAGGAIALTLWGVIVPFALIVSIFPAGRTYIVGQFFKKVTYPLSWIIEGAANMIRGVTQVAATPLTNLIKLPLRGILTAIANFRGKKFLAEKKPQIQRLAIEAYSKLDQVNRYETLNDPAESDIFTILEAIEKKCKLHENQYEAKRNVVDLLQKIKDKIAKDTKDYRNKYIDKGTYLFLRKIDKTLKKAENAILFDKNSKKLRKLNETEKQEIRLLAQIRNEIRGEKNNGGNDNKMRVNKQTEEIRQTVAALLFEVRRKYQKSIKNGWDSDSGDITTQFNSTFVLFNKKSSDEDKDNKIISPKDIQAVRQCLEIFIPENLTREEKKFYVIGHSIQVRNMSWLSGIPTSRKDIQENDIVNSLKVEELIYIFDDFATAKRYADIRAKEDYEYKNSRIYRYTPVIEVALLDQNERQIEYPNNHDLRYIRLEAATNHLEKLLVDIDKDGLSTISVNNIKYISGYCHQYDKYWLGSNEQKGKITPVNYIDFQKEIENKIPSHRRS